MAKKGPHEQKHFFENVLYKLCVYVQAGVLASRLDEVQFHSNCTN